MQTVNLPEAQLLAPYLPEGVESEKVYARHATGTPRKGNKHSYDMGWSDWELKERLHYRNSAVQEIPAPTLCEMLGLLPNAIYTPTCKRTSTCDRANVDCFSNVEWCWTLHQQDDGRSIIGYRCESRHLLKHIKYDNPATAASKLYRWLADNGHIERATK